MAYKNQIAYGLKYGHVIRVKGRGLVFVKPRNNKNLDHLTDGIKHMCLTGSGVAHKHIEGGKLHTYQPLNINFNK